MTKIVLILHDIRSAHNVGAIFRTADAAGVAKIYFTGYTPAPRDQFERVNKEIMKTALGAERVLEWEARPDIFELAKTLKANDYKLIALEQHPNSVDYKEIQTLGVGASLTSSVKMAIILGNEVDGIPPEILKKCAQIAEIKMHGAKESLNVAVACGIALFRWLDN